MSRLADPAGDELTRPLGTEAPKPSSRLPGSMARLSAAALGLIVVAAVAYASWFGDRFGGVPVTRVSITTAPESPPARLESDASGPKGTSAVRDGGTRDAAEIESASGVAVTRPPGTAAPSSVIVAVPENPSGLAPAPDGRLVERSRFGPLPRLGPEGLRAADFYARPAGRLPGGVKPAGIVAIVVGGLGISQSGTADAIARLPPEVTLAFAPYAANVEAMAAAARQGGHEIMLQVPMEPFDYPDSDPGPHTLTVAAGATGNLDHLRWALGRFPGYIGIVNYMGAKLTADPAALSTVLRELDSRGLVMLDDASSSRSRVTEVAGPGKAARADVVLDAVARPDAIDKALQGLEATARSRGIAIGSATAFPATIDRIARWAATLAAHGILLVPVSAAMIRAPALASRAPAERAGP